MCYKLIKDIDGKFIAQKGVSTSMKWFTSFIIMVFVESLIFYGLIQLFWMIRNPVGGAAAIGARAFGLIGGKKKILKY